MTTLQALLVEDNPGDARLIKEALVEMGEPRLQLAWVDTLAKGLEQLAARHFDLILLDLSLPDSQGMGTVKHIEQAAPTTPIVVLTGLDDEAVAVAAVRSGAQDYLVKSEAEPHLLARVIRYAIERNHIHQTLRENEARLTALFEHMGSGVAVFRAIEEGADFVFGAFNRAAERIDHIPREQVIGKRLLEMFPGANEFGLLDAFRRVWQSGRSEHLPVSFYHDGRIAGWRENYVYRLPNGEIVAIYDDITERKQAEEQLRLAARVFESSAEGIVITDLKGHILSVNEAFSAITGYPLEEIRGQNPRVLKSGKHDPAFYRDMWKSILKDGHWQGEVWNRRKNGEVYPEWMNIGSVKDEHGQISHFVGTFTDITQRKAAEERIHFLAHHDALTGLPNRVLLQDRISQSVAICQHQGGKAGLLLIDLDRFKTINESLNHAFGDQLLQEVAQRIEGCARRVDTVARSGGDEFVVLLTEVRDIAEIAAAANNILITLSQPFTLDGHEINITSSIGISVYPDDGDNAQHLLKNADVAMYRAKDMGRNNYQFYTQDMNARTFETLVLENSLRHALKRDDFVLHYQPQIDIAGGAMVGVEALLRMRHPELGLVPPGTFIPIAEETGLIVPIGVWVINEACRQGRLWRDAGLTELRIAVNLSAKQFLQPGLLDVVEKALAESGLPPQQLELELTESILMRDSDVIIETLRRFKKMGVQLSIDDFGTGFSSLSYLKRFDLDRLKIDQSFVRDITSDPDDLAIARAVIALGHSLGLKVIAEGVESGEQLELLRANGCDEIQGYYFSRPQPAAEIPRFFRGE
jgi:diguanylate cyclase (GGDEF)-like protein/PAS domain S-box-containing protein